MLNNFKAIYRKTDDLIKRRNKVNELICFLFFFVLFEPRYFFYVEKVNKVFSIALMAISVVLLIYYVFFEWCKWSKITVLCLVYHAYLCVVTLFRNGDMVNAIQDSLFFCSICILTEYCLKYNPRFLYTKLLFLLSCEVVINLISIVWLKGLYSASYVNDGYFFGNRNQMINVLLPAIMLGYIYALSQKKFSRSILFLLLGISLFSVIYTDSKASSLMTVLMLFPILCLINFSNLFNMATYLCANLLGFFLIVIVRIQEKMEAFIAFVFAGRNATFSGRDVIWNRTIQLISENPFFGYGLEKNADRIAKYADATFGSLHAHNRFLETMYRGGIVLTIIYAVMLFIVVFSLTKNRKLDVAKIVSFTLFVYLVGMLTEFYRYSYFFFPMMVIAENIVAFQNSVEKDLESVAEEKRRILGIWPRIRKI